MTVVTKRGHVVDEHLWQAVKSEARQRYTKMGNWPSAYASAWLTKEYKRRGGEFIGPKNAQDGGIGRWFKEQWQQADGKPCGRKRAKKGRKGLPVCRPTVRISEKTPKTWNEMTESEKEKWVSGKMRRNQKSKK